jgi:D-alanine-D-alanine ligase
MLKKIKLALVFGGRSAEHEVSVKSAKNICEAIDKDRFEPVLIGISQTGTWFYFESEKDIQTLKVIKDDELKSKFPVLSFSSVFQKPVFIPLDENSKTSSIVIEVDVVFPIMHGSFGEDGCIQGLFQMMNLPFVGCGVLSSSLSMDKDMMKRVFIQSGIPTSDWIIIRSWELLPKYEELVQKLGSPFFIKPANAGSSVGVHKIKNAGDFEKGIKDAFLYDHKVLAERYIAGREIECSILGLIDSPQASVPGEVITQHEFYSYEAKYLDENGAIIRIPADLKSDEIEKIQSIAKKVYTCLECSGLSRIDFFLTPQKDIYVNEINTIPGFTNISMYPKMWEASGVSYKKLISNLIDLAFQKYQFENKLKRTFL